MFVEGPGGGGLPDPIERPDENDEEDEDDPVCHTWHPCDVETNLYEVGWENFGQAWSTINDPNSNWLFNAYSAVYILGWGGAHAGLLIGAAGLACAAAGPSCVMAVEGILGIGSAASADGDPTNEVYSVYRLVENGTTKYYGMTNNFLRRANEHFYAKGWQIERIPGLRNLTKFDARAVEQVLIEHAGGPKSGNIYNQINSIATSNPIYPAAIQRGTEILQRLGIIN